MLVQGTDGNFYGTTSLGGAYSGCGTVFKITPTGALTTLHSFTGADGCSRGGLVQATDGNFYGTTGEGGNFSCFDLSGCGTVFKITPAGTLTTLHSFDGVDGSEPEGGLVQATDGNFYGANYFGGDLTCRAPSGCGTIFKITSGGALTTLQIFEGTDGALPNAPMQATNGNLYGTTAYGGNIPCAPNGCGTVFRLSGPSPSPVQFVPLTPCRLADTRPDHGGSGPIQGGNFQIFDLPQLAQTKGCADLSSATAYSLNIAVVPQGPLGYLTLWPTNGSRPGVATLNSLDGRIKANAAIVRAGSAGAVSVYVTNTTERRD